MYGDMRKNTGKIIALFMVICALSLSLMNGCVRLKIPAGTTAVVTETTASVTNKSSGKTKETTEKTPSQTTDDTDPKASVDENGTYYSAEDVALYIHTYNKLPSNYITKKEAKALGWLSLIHI